jgi:hypothetical protein
VERGRRGESEVERQESIRKCRKRKNKRIYEEEAKKKQGGGESEER